MLRYAVAPLEGKCRSKLLFLLSPSKWYKDLSRRCVRRYWNNWTYHLFLGSRGLTGCYEISKRMNVPLSRVLYKPREEVFIFSNFNRPVADAIYDVRTHPCYDKLESEQYQR